MGKGRPWCADLPAAKIAKASNLKRLTLILPYYENPSFLHTQVETWRRYPAELSAQLSIIVVDDGSPVPCVKPDLPNVRLFQIGVDIRWNWLAARNIGAHHAENGWLLLTDMDHVLPESTLRAVVSGQHDPRVVYAFSRREHTGEAISPHSASFLMTRDLFWRIGGYDERCSGFYGTDGLFRRRIVQHATMHVLPEPLIRHEFVSDASTTRYQRKQPEDGLLKKLVASFKRGSPPKTLSFPYREVSV